MKSSSSRNKTIILSPSEQEYYLNQCTTSSKDCLDKTINGDFFKIAPTLQKGIVDLLIVDPPYNLNKNFNGFKFKEQSITDYTIYTEKWLDLCIPLLKPTASVYVCCDWKSSMVIGNVLASRLNIRNRITWQRDKGRGAKANWKNAMEDIWFCTISDDYVFNLDNVKQRRKVLAPYTQNGNPKDWQELNGMKFRDTAPSNFWDDITIPYWSMQENTPHPTQKPEKLLAKLILASSNPGDLVLDPFLGSGSTSVTAKKLNRHFIGIEMDKSYCAVTQYRLHKAQDDKSIQGYNGVFYERNTRF